MLFVGGVNTIIFIMRIFIIGALGMLGREFSRQLMQQNIPFIGLDREHLDITSLSDIRYVLDPYEGDYVLINCAAYTAVDACEEAVTLANDINGTGPTLLAAYCEKRGWPLIHFSTDYVFNGQKEGAYAEDDCCDPINAYGHSKWLGERGIQSSMSSFFIFRIQWLYGDGPTHFLNSMASFAQEESIIRVVNDQWGSPTWTVSVVDSVLSLLKSSHREAYGIYHLCNQGYTNWFDYATEFFRLRPYSGIQLKPISSEGFLRPAKRPNNGRLDLDKWLSLGVGDSLSHWKIALSRFVKLDTRLSGDILLSK